jgi:2-haloacid dehalogenase
MNMAKYELVLLDADGTLFDFVTAQTASQRGVFEQYGFPFSEEVRTRYQEISDYLWEEFEHGKIQQDFLQVERWRRLLDEFGFKADPVAFNNAYLNLLAKGSFLLSGALEVCRDLAKHCTVAVASNGIARVQRNRLAISPIRPYVKHLIVSEDAGHAKPHRGFFEYAFRVCGHEDKGTTIIVGDSLGADVKGGVDFGIATCWYNPTGAANDSGTKADYEIRDLRELFALIL